MLARRRRWWTAYRVATALLAVLATAARGEVFHAKDEALALAFPAGTTVQLRTAILTDSQVAACKAKHIDVGSKLFTYYTGTRDGNVVGYAVIDSHVVRTLPEAFMAVLSPEGAVQKVVMLAFYEPPEYAPSAKWLAQFEGKRLDGGWRVGGDVHGIGGSTLTAHAMAGAVRKIVFLHELVIRPSAS